ncbi:transposase, partial [Kocuria rosea]|uniref:transposase n=1 Tax=Kocuria rosea TaxID=1275 RepID=UPI00232C0F7A
LAMPHHPPPTTDKPRPDNTRFCNRLYDVEIRRVICTTNAIESINARYRRAVRARGHFPNEAAALKCLYLVTRSLDPTGGGRARWVMRWKPALNAFAITFAGRFERTTH